MIEPPAQHEEDATKTGLDRLFEAAAHDSSREPEFFRALLDAHLYAHAPLHDQFESVEGRSTRVRLVMFKNPDTGTLVIPVFTDRVKAEFAARGNVRLVEAVGREMLEGMRGATVMLNPNDVRCTLYPEEISALLANEHLPQFEADKTEEGQARIFKLPKVPEPLVKALREALPAIPGVERAYLAGVQWQEPGRPDSVLVALVGPLRDREHSARATIVALRVVIERWKLLVDVMHFDHSKPDPEWIAHLRLKPVYRRRQGPVKASPLN